MDTLTKQINVSIPKQVAYDNVLAVSKLPQFSLASEDKLLNKVVLSYLLSQVEIYVESKSDSESVLKITILDKNGSRTIVPDIAENVMLNFENAFSAVANGDPASFTPVNLQMDTGSAVNGILGFIIAVIGILILIYVFTNL